MSKIALIFILAISLNCAFLTRRMVFSPSCELCSPIRKKTGHSAATRRSPPDAAEVKATNDTTTSMFVSVSAIKSKIVMAGILFPIFLFPTRWSPSPSKDYTQISLGFNSDDTIFIEPDSIFVILGEKKISPDWASYLIVQKKDSLSSFSYFEKLEELEIEKARYGWIWKIIPIDIAFPIETETNDSFSLSINSVRSADKLLKFPLVTFTKKKQWVHVFGP